MPDDVCPSDTRTVFWSRAVADAVISRTKPAVGCPLTFTDTGPEIAVLGTITVRLVAVAVEAGTSTVPVAVLNTTKLLLAIVLKFDPVSVTVVLRVVRATEIALSTATSGGVKVIPDVSDPAATLARKEPLPEKNSSSPYSGTLFVVLTKTNPPLTLFPTSPGPRSFAIFSPGLRMKLAVDAVAGPPINPPPGYIAKTSTFAEVLVAFNRATPVDHGGRSATCRKSK